MQHTLRRNKTSISSRHSDESQESQSTAPTQYSSGSRPSIQHAATYNTPWTKPSYDISPSATDCARASTETYASTIESQSDSDDEEEDFGDSEYDLPEYQEVYETNVTPSNASNFAAFFPTTKRMYIRHDDTTPDGNMNLRVDSVSRTKGTVQLFHLRMQDLKKRDFSFRRYERSSGREICHVTRKYVKPAASRPPLTKSVSTALASMRKPDLKRTDTVGSQTSHRSFRSGRQDSGYGSDNDADSSHPRSSGGKKFPVPTNITKLEFSNYAQVEVSRRGTTISKRYDFDYWGHSYSWKRLEEKDGHGKAVSYHLFRGEGNPSVAHIVPEMRSPAQIRLEKEVGGWIPPSSMWISDTTLIESGSDVCDVIVATGLVALVDDCIKRHFHPKPQKYTAQLSLPLTPLKYDMEFITPRALVENIFKRRNSGGAVKEREHRNSPLRRHTDVMATY